MNARARDLSLKDALIKCVNHILLKARAVVSVNIRGTLWLLALDAKTVIHLAPQKRHYQKRFYTMDKRDLPNPEDVARSPGSGQNPGASSGPSKEGF